MHIPKTIFLVSFCKGKVWVPESFSSRKHSPYIISSHLGILHSHWEPIIPSKKRECLKNAQRSSSLGLFTSFLHFPSAHCDLTDGWFGQGWCQASVKPVAHKRKNSHVLPSKWLIPWPHIHHLAHPDQLFSAHCRATLLAPAVPFLPRWLPGASVCVVWG